MLSQMEKDMQLRAAVKSFFEDYLHYTEVSDSGREFRPITIGCCRAMMTKPLGELLEKMRELAGVEKPRELNKDNDYET